jgi:hypothetical protein
MLSRNPAVRPRLVLRQGEFEGDCHSEPEQGGGEESQETRD